jgi:hypothetical protein
MYSQFDYFTAIAPDFPEIQTIARVTGISGMEEVMENIRQLKTLALLVEDDSDGYLNLEHGNFDFSYHAFSIFDVAKLNDSAERNRAQNTCFTTGLKILRRMLTDSTDFGDPCYGFDRSRISYMRIGPMINNTFGYTFTYTMRNENFNLV